MPILIIMEIKRELGRVKAELNIDKTNTVIFCTNFPSQFIMRLTGEVQR